MKRAAVSASAVLLALLILILGAGLVFYLRRAPAGAAMVAVVPALTTEAGTRTERGGGVELTPGPSEKETATAKKAREEEEENALMQKMSAQLAERLTPEHQKRSVEMLMQARVPRYQALFSEWELDAGTGERALALIREREVVQSRLTVEAYRVVAQAPVEQAMTTAVETGRKRRDQELLDDVELIALLGYPRYEALKRVDDAHKKGLFNPQKMED